MVVTKHGAVLPAVASALQLSLCTVSCAVLVLTCSVALVDVQLLDCTTSAAVSAR